jgi:hypothetical protein
MANHRRAITEQRPPVNGACCCPAEGTRHRHAPTRGVEHETGCLVGVLDLLDGATVIYPPGPDGEPAIFSPKLGAYISYP